MPTASIGSEVDVEELLRRVRPIVRRMARYAARRLHTGREDIFAEFMLAIRKYAHHYDPARGSTGWFAKRQCQRVFGTRFWQRWAALVIAGRDDLPHPPDHRDTDPAGLVIRAEDVARLRAALADLPERERRAVTLRFGLGDGDEYTGDRLASALGIGLTMTTVALREGVRKLAVALGADPDLAAVSQKAARARATRERTGARG